MYYDNIMIIHTIGDSHSQFGDVGYTLSQLVLVRHLGPILCYSFGNEILNRCDIRNFNIQNGDTIIFCLGEIDCRCHIHKHITETMTYQQIIDSIVEKYFEAIKVNIVTSNLKLKHICVYNIVPPIQKENTPEDHDYPFLGSDEERKKYVLYFNKKLKEKCTENNYIFFDIYDKYTDENGFLRKDLSDDRVHIKDKTYILQFIKENILG